ncbi:MAG: hypothetical protein WC867_00885 [Candidatus Pacearchaeota archaeon]|jgi:H+/Cl- antiporter ClcA
MIEKFGVLFEKSFKEYKENFETFLVILVILSLIPSLFMYLFSYNFGSYMQVLNEDSPFEQINEHIMNYPYLIPLIILVIIVSLLSCWLATTLIYYSLNASKNKKLSIIDSLQGGAKNFFKYLGMMILFGLILFLFLIPLFILFAFLYYGNNTYLMFYFIFVAVLYVILFIPFIMFIVYWIFAPYFLIDQKKSIIDSIRASKQLVENYWFETLAYLIFILVITIVISIPFSLFLKGIKYFIDYIFILGLIELILNFLISIITYPLITLFIKNLYLEMKNEKDKKIDSKSRKKKKKNE